jgi:uncharacterized alkaline shock family protein YloU
MATATETRPAAATDMMADSGLTLQTDKGITTVSDAVVAKLAGHACREVEGVAGMGAAFRRLLSRVKPGQEALSQGVNVEVGKKEAAIDIVILVQYGYPIPTLAQEVRENVITTVETHTGLIVKEVNIEIDDMQFEDDRRDVSRVE